MALKDTPYHLGFACCKDFKLSSRICAQGLAQHPKTLFSKVIR